MCTDTKRNLKGGGGVGLVVSLAAGSEGAAVRGVRGAGGKSDAVALRRRVPVQGFCSLALPLLVVVEVLPVVLVFLVSLSLLSLA